MSFLKTECSCNFEIPVNKTKQNQNETNKPKQCPIYRRKLLGINVQYLLHSQLEKTVSVEDSGMTPRRNTDLS